MNFPEVFPHSKLKSLFIDRYHPHICHCFECGSFIIILVDQFKMSKILPLRYTFLVVFWNHLDIALDKKVNFFLHFLTGSFLNTVETEWNYRYFVYDVRFLPKHKINSSENKVRRTFFMKLRSEIDISALL